MAGLWVVTDGSNPRLPGNQIIEIQTKARKRHKMHAYLVRWPNIHRYRVLIMGSTMQDKRSDTPDPERVFYEHGRRKQDDSTRKD